MRRLIFALALFTASIAQARSAGRSGKGLGLSIGDPTGLNFKAFLKRGFAIDSTLGLGFIGGRHFALNVSAIWQKPLSNLGSAPVDWYWGLGGKLGLYDGDDDHSHGNGRVHDHDHDDELRLGARAPLGIAILFKSAPIDVFLEVAAGLWLLDHVDLDLDGAIGLRFWF